MELHEKIEQVQSKEDLAEFIMKLRDDLRVNAESWDNQNLDQFLEAMAAWVSAMDFWAKNKGIPQVESPSWKMIAQILYAAKIYEWRCRKRSGLMAAQTIGPSGMTRCKPFERYRSTIVLRTIGLVDSADRNASLVP